MVQVEGGVLLEQVSKAEKERLKKLARETHVLIVALGAVCMHRGLDRDRAAAEITKALIGVYPDVGGEAIDMYQSVIAELSRANVSQEDLIQWYTLHYQGVSAWAKGLSR